MLPALQRFQEAFIDETVRSTEATIRRAEEVVAAKGKKESAAERAEWEPERQVREGEEKVG